MPAPPRWLRRSCCSTSRWCYMSDRSRTSACSSSSPADSPSPERERLYGAARRDTGQIRHGHEEHNVGHRLDPCRGGDRPLHHASGVQFEGDGDQDQGHDRHQREDAQQRRQPGSRSQPSARERSHDENHRQERRRNPWVLGVNVVTTPSAVFAQDMSVPERSQRSGLSGWSPFAHGMALALPTKVALARPTGLEPATFGSGTQRSIH